MVQHFCGAPCWTHHCVATLHTHLGDAPALLTRSHVETGWGLWGLTALKTALNCKSL